MHKTKYKNDILRNFSIKLNLNEWKNNELFYF